MSKKQKKVLVRMIVALLLLAGVILLDKLALLPQWAMIVLYLVPYFVIGYECAILLGGTLTLLGIFHLCRIPDVLRKIGYDPRFSDDKFGLVIDTPGDEVARIRGVLEQCGAEEVKIEPVL